MGKYRLVMGCHNGGIASRDSSASEHDTEAEARAAYQRGKQYFASIGYYVWFADIYAPDGKGIFHDNGVPYQR